MANNLPAINPKVLGLIKGSFGKDGLPLPFTKEIYLMDCYVAGTSYLDLGKVEAGLVVGSPLVFKREPENPHDPLAILIFDEHGNKLGYVPRQKNEVISRLMDSGKLFFGKLEEKNREGFENDWLKLVVKVYMRDI